MVRVSEILQLEHVKVPLLERDKQGVIGELVDLLAQHGQVRQAQTLKQAVWAREMTRTTGIGHGVAIPHGKGTGVDALSMAIGRLAEPVDFGAVDGQPVKLVMLLVSPEDQTGPHIQALARISRLLTDIELREAMKQAQSPEALYELIRKREAEGQINP